MSLPVARGQDKRHTAQEVIAQIQQHAGIPWMKETVDTFKAGDPNTEVTGIATTMMATFDVLQRAAANHQNLIITHEPTFYAHVDRPEGMAESDAVWAEIMKGRAMSAQTSSSSSSGVGFLGLLAILFIALKLLGVIHWSWWWVLAPLWGGALIVLGLCVLIFCIAWRNKA